MAVNYTNTYVEKSKKIRHKSKLVKVRINNKKSIDLRLKRIVLMMTAGHWEVDTIFWVKPEIIFTYYG